MTDEDRREVAERLRELDVDVTSRDTLERAVDKLMKAVYGEQPFSPVRYSVRNLCGLGYVLADLIDPTCRFLPTFNGGFGCDRCYTWFQSMETKPNYCPSCGARVVDDE